MNLYVESNFTLELARLQEEAPQAEELLRLAEEKRIHLCFPSLAVIEPFSALDRYANERGRFLQILDLQLNDLSRSGSTRALADTLKLLVKTLTAVRTDEMDRLEQAVERMLAAGEVIELTSARFARARQAELQYDMSPQDAIVFASIIDHLEAFRNKSDAMDCFVSRNSKDFRILTGEFRSRQCEYKPKFGAALAFVRSQLES